MEGRTDGRKDGRTEGKKEGRRQRKIYASFLSQKSSFHCCKALTAVAHAASPRPTNPQYAIPGNKDGKTGIFFSLEKSGLGPCAGGKLQWDFLSLCRARALQKTQLGPFLPQGHQVLPGTRGGCSEPGPRSDPGGTVICAVGASTHHDCFVL